MENRDELLDKIRNGNFRENNGKVLMMMNIIRGKYIALKDVLYALDGMDEGSLVKSADFLQEEGYIRLRGTKSKQETTLADAAYTTLEAKLTGKGDRLLNRELRDQMIDVW